MITGLCMDCGGFVQAEQCELLHQATLHVLDNPDAHPTRELHLIDVDTTAKRLITEALT